ncbi:GATA zinc finger domain containing protein [Acanthamoeba castellanii str. Neff]|uniref:GATA zinc finger domain containing protein n=1 Tax=Acanthamoeba castellanii (strain ATCC 30010 / Neff) TaxID=1257118 RepID=L8GJ17_ACACF|nr:GATA zinc finger domain containing protein [Acanthamoeba castellanii str. Neff]ELR12156.1 GATA zinc finger domain containing protein [Acanthamoeba castellanii str. Neff]
MNTARPTTTFTPPDQRAQLLEQVSLFANGVRRLSNKMNSQGGLSKSEEGLLDTHMHLLRQKVYQLHGPMVFIPQPPQRHHQQQQQQPQHHLHLQQSLMTQPINRHIAPCSDSPPTTAPRPASPQRRRTKRMFTDRACHHCETRFTSQWRTGPSGPSTLCNACGIRYARQVKLDRARRSSSPAAASSPIAEASPLLSTGATSPQSQPDSPPLARASVHFLLN